MKKLVLKSEVKKVNLKELNSYEVPNWQRWKNNSNVNSLIESLKIIGQQREILVCELPNGRKLLTDGNHLKNAMIGLKYKNAWVRVSNVKTEEDAFRLFVEFNTRGRSLSTLDFVVSRSSFSESNIYRTFLNDILNNPSDEKEAKALATKHKLFSIPALINIFLGTSSVVKKGNSSMPKNYERLKSVYKYIDKRYIYTVGVKSLMDIQKQKKLNGGSIIPVMNEICSKDYEHLGNEQILKVLVDFSLYYHKTYPSIQFNKDNVATSFKTFLTLIGLKK
jgi:hypothetical protein|tara:strand:+ start:690 stop:1523 length:834 start_codon:yes stop_codon:yes gene_type:complete